jgi:hypothetical protein
LFLNILLPCFSTVTQSKPNPPSLARLVTTPPGNSWADKVKGIKSPPVLTPPAVVPSEDVTVEEVKVVENVHVQKEVKEPKKALSEDGGCFFYLKHGETIHLYQHTIRTVMENLEKFWNFTFHQKSLKSP